jgi:hypothetical protein
VAITVGSASGSTGLAGRIRAALDTLFAAVTRDFSAGSVGDKGTNAYAQGLVDALNNDKVGVDQVESLARVASCANQSGSTVFSAAAWADLPLATTGTNGYTGKSTTRSVVARLSFSAYSQVAGQSVQLRCVVDGTPTAALTVFFNASQDHRAWPLLWILGPLAAGAHTVKVQINPAAGTVTADTNDFVSFEVAEVA